MTHSYLSLDKVLAWESEAARRGVSEVARSNRGFLRAYEAAGSARALSPEWRAKREGFIARHMVQASNEPWFDSNGRPTRRHLALIMWAYSPQPSRLRRDNPVMDSDAAGRQWAKEVYEERLASGKLPNLGRGYTREQRAARAVQSIANSKLFIGDRKAPTLTKREISQPSHKKRFWHAVLAWALEQEQIVNDPQAWQSGVDAVIKFASKGGDLDDEIDREWLQSKCEISIDSVISRLRAEGKLPKPAKGNPVSKGRNARFTLEPPDPLPPYVPTAKKLTLFTREDGIEIAGGVWQEGGGTTKVPELSFVARFGPKVSPKLRKKNPGDDSIGRLDLHPEPEEPGVFWVGQVAVAPKLQRMGIATDLYREAVKWLRQRGGRLKQGWITSQAAAKMWEKWRAQGLAEGYYLKMDEWTPQPSRNPVMRRAKKIPKIPKEVQPYAGGDGWCHIPQPSSGEILFTTSSESGKLEAVEILGRGESFDQIRGLKFRWLTGPDMGTSQDTYGRSFWALESPAKRNPVMGILTDSELRAAAKSNPAKTLMIRMSDMQCSLMETYFFDPVWVEETRLMGDHLFPGVMRGKTLEVFDRDLAFTMLTDRANQLDDEYEYLRRKTGVNAFPEGRDWARHMRNAATSLASKILRA